MYACVFMYLCVYIYLPWVLKHRPKGIPPELSKALLLSSLFLTSNIHRPHDVDTLNAEMLGNFCPVLSTTVQKRIQKVRGKDTVIHWGQWVEEKVKKGTTSRSPISINSTGQALLFHVMPLYCRVTTGEPCPFISLAAKGSKWPGFP